MNKFFTIILAASIGISAYALHDRPLKRQADGVASSVIHDGRLNGKRLSLSKRMQSRNRVHDNKFKLSRPNISSRPLLSQRSVGTFSPDIDLRGCVTYSSTWTSGSPYGIYKIPLKDGDDFVMLRDEIDPSYGGFEDGQGNYVAVSAHYNSWAGDYEVEIHAYDTRTWTEVEGYNTYCDQSIMATDVAYDPTTGRIYGCYNDDEGYDYVWGYADYHTGVRTIVSPIDYTDEVTGLGCDAQGNFYAVLYSGDFVSIDKNTGVFTKIGETGLNIGSRTSACIDPVSGAFLFSCLDYDDIGALYEIDRLTGQASLITVYPGSEQVQGMYVAKAVAGKSPVAPALQVNSDGTSLEVAYTIGVPDKCIDGSALEGRVIWRLMIGGNEADALTGVASPGENVTGKITLTAKGEHKFEAEVENSVGVSELAQQTLFVGAGSPPAPEYIDVWFNGYDFEVSWERPEESTDGGYMDPDFVTFDVYMNGSLIERDYGDTYYVLSIDDVDKFGKYTFGVASRYNGDVSDVTYADPVAIGFRTPPYAPDLSRKDVFGDFTTVDGNDDDISWKWENGEVFYQNSRYADADDWLITPPVKLESGKFYELSFNVAGTSERYTERMEVAMGAAPDPVKGEVLDVYDIDRTVVDELDIICDRNSPMTVSRVVSVTENGNYVFGFHCISPKDMFRLYLSEIGISEGMAATAPAQPSDVQAMPDISGTLKATVSFNAPVKSVDGLELVGNLSKVVVSRNGVEIMIFDNVVPGSHHSFEDMPESKGTYKYTVTGYDSEGNRGLSSEISVFVGPTVPNPVTTVNMTETSTPGEVLLTWDAPVEDINGNPLDESNLSYMVYTSTSDGFVPLTTSPIVERELTVRACEPEEQVFAAYYVLAINCGVEPANELGVTEMMPVGRPYDVPFRFSFNDVDFENYQLAMDVSGGGTWVFMNDASGIPSQDDDDVFVAMRAYAPDENSAVSTGKISLKNLEKPVLTFWTYAFGLMPADELYGDEIESNGIEVYIIENGKENYATYADHSKYDERGWKKITVDLSRYVGKDIQIKLQAYCSNYVYTPVDNIQVGEAREVDLALERISAPGKVESEKIFPVCMTLSNEGSERVTNAIVELYKENEKVGEQTIARIEPDGRLRVTFDVHLNPLDDEYVRFHGSLNCSADRFADNNSTDVVSVARVVNELPVVNTLKAEYDGTGAIALSWQAPDMSTALADAVTETFESALDWSDEVEGWTMVDVDNAGIGGIQGYEFPAPLAPETLHSFVVINSFADEVLIDGHPYGDLAPNSGQKSLACFFTYYGVEQDDWAITPELNGQEQTISFYAHSFSADYLDHLDVLYTLEDSVDPADYMSLTRGEGFVVPSDFDSFGKPVYNRYEFRVPEGTRHVAFRCNQSSPDGFILLIDDVTYIPANAPCSLAVEGYDIYRNGIKTAQVPDNVTSYVDMEGEPGSRYNLVVRYNQGLSERSNEATAEASGVISTVDSSWTAESHSGMIVVRGTAGSEVTVTSADGRIVSICDGDCNVRTGAGVYVVSASGKAVKLIVR